MKSNGKFARYQELKRKERAKHLSESQNITLEEAIQHLAEEESNLKKLRKNKKSKSAQRRETKSTQHARDNELNSFGNKLVSSLRPVQGGAPGNGKR